MICTLDAIPVIKIEMQAANLTLIVDFALKNFFLEMGYKNSKHKDIS